MLSRSYDKISRDIFRGLHSGANNSLGATEIALIFSAGDSPAELQVIDPLSVLRPHRASLKTQYTSASFVDISTSRLRTDFSAVKAVEVDGFSTGSRLESAAFQAHGAPFVQFFGRHFEGTAFDRGSLKLYLRKAGWLLAVAFSDHDTRSGGRQVLETLANQLLIEVVVKVTLEREQRIRAVLESISAISRTKEEGKRPRGTLAFVPDSNLDSNDLTVTLGSPRPRLANAKHVCKLLPGTDGISARASNTHQRRMLVTDGVHILGILDGEIPPSSLAAVFGSSGGEFLLRSKSDPRLIGAFSDGFFFLSKADSFRKTLDREILRKRLVPGKMRDRLVQAISDMISLARLRGHGCSIAVGPQESKLPRWSSGERIPRGLPLLDTSRKPPEVINSNVDIAANVAAIDGALHISPRGKLLAFGALLDGMQTKDDQEDRARGARHNSAIRFTSYRRKMVVVTASEDGPVSVFSDGKALITTQRSELPVPKRNDLRPMPFAEWA